MAKGNDIDLEAISMKKWKCEKKRVNKRKTKIIMGGVRVIKPYKMYDDFYVPGCPNAFPTEEEAWEYIEENY